MKYKNRLSYLNLVLNIILIVLALPFIAAFFATFSRDISIKAMALQVLVQLVFYGGYIMIVVTLKKILKSVSLRNPFNSNNVEHFKRIGYYILLVGVIYAIISYPIQYNSNFEIMSTSYGSIKPTVFLYIVLSLFSFIMSDVFRMAMEIKDENDLTV